MKIILTESQFKRVILKEEIVFNDQFDKLYIHDKEKKGKGGFCQFAFNTYQIGDYSNLTNAIRRFNDIKLKELKDGNVINLSSEEDIRNFIHHLPERIYEKCPPLMQNRSRNMIRAIVEDKNTEVLNVLVRKYFNKQKNDNTDVVANFDKEKVTDDLANKTTIKDGVVHVPFAIDDFPTEDWDLYFEDFNVSNDKFDFSGYLKKEYGAGDVDAEDIWNEYQEAVLHRLMDNS